MCITSEAGSGAGEREETGMVELEGLVLQPHLAHSHYNVAS